MLVDPDDGGSRGLRGRRPRHRGQAEPVGGGGRGRGYDREGEVEVVFKVEVVVVEVVGDDGWVPGGPQQVVDLVKLLLGQGRPRTGLQSVQAEGLGGCKVVGCWRVRVSKLFKYFLCYG